MNNSSKISIIIACGIIIFVWGVYPIPHPEWFKYTALLIGPLITFSAFSLKNQLKNDINKNSKK